MGLLIQLAIYGAIIGAVAFGAHKAWDGFKSDIAAPYVQAQIAADQKVVDEANRIRARAEKQAAESQADIDSCTATLDTQSVEVDRWKATAAQRLKETQKARADALLADAAKKQSIAQLQEIARRPPVKDETCQQKLDKVDKLLRDAARARQGAAK